MGAFVERLSDTPSWKSRSFQRKRCRGRVQSAVHRGRGRGISRRPYALAHEGAPFNAARVGGIGGANGTRAESAKRVVENYASRLLIIDSFSRNRQTKSSSDLRRLFCAGENFRQRAQLAQSENSCRTCLHLTVATVTRSLTVHMRHNLHHRCGSKPRIPIVTATRQRNRNLRSKNNARRQRIGEKGKLLGDHIARFKIGSEEDVRLTDYGRADTNVPRGFG